MAHVFAFAETRDGQLRKVALETVSAARQLADQLGGEVHAVVAGAAGVGALVDQLAQYGADVVALMEHPTYAFYNRESIAATVAERVRAGGYRVAMFSASAQGRDLAPRVAAKIDAPMAADVVTIELAGDVVTVTHPAYAGKVLATLTLAGAPVVLSVRPSSFPPRPSPRTARAEALPPVGDPAASRVVVREIVQSKGAALDLGEAPVIVSGGRGLRSAENFKLVEELAAAFGNAAVGATRAVTDEGWRPHSDQIGQTGRLVSPELYVAVGISGAIQHLAGMRTAKTIVAINKDRDAPIFKVADYGIVGDVFEVVPALTAAVREAKKAHG